MSQSNAIFLGCLFFVHAQLFIARSPQSPCSCVQELFHSIIMLYPELVTFFQYELYSASSIVRLVLYEHEGCPLCLPFC